MHKALFQRPLGPEIPLGLELEDVIADLDPGFVDWATRIDAVAAERAWFTPPRPSAEARASDVAAIAGSRPISVVVDGRRRPGYTLGQGPLVVLAHGWGGRAAQLGELAVRLAEAGLQPVAIDLPGHGTDLQSTSDIGQMAAGLAAVANDFGHPSAVVAHSLGALASVVAFRAHPPAAAVFIAPFLVTELAIDRFARRSGLSSEVTNRLRAAVQRVAGDLWPLVNAGPAADLPGAELLVVHDPTDLEAPFEVTAALASRRPRTTVLEAAGLGHTGMLHDPSVVDVVATFLAGTIGQLRRAG